MNSSKHTQPQCDDSGSRRPVSAVVVAIVVLLVVVIMFHIAPWIGGGRRREGFVSQKARDVFNSSKPLLDAAKGNVSYSAFKTQVPGADPVTYTDVRRLWKDGKLSPETVQSVI